MSRISQLAGQHHMPKQQSMTHPRAKPRHDAMKQTDCESWRLIGSGPARSHTAGHPQGLVACLAARRKNAVMYLHHSGETMYMAAYI